MDEAIPAGQYRDVDAPIPGRESAHGEEGGVIVSRLSGHHAIDQPPRCLEVHEVHHRLEQRCVHPLATAGSLA